MKRLFVSTCGTSLFTNGASSEERTALGASANDSEAALRGRPERAVVEDRIAERTKALEGATAADAQKWSAELNGLVSYPGAFEGGAHHIFLVTDTAQGKAGGEACASWVRTRGATAEVCVLEDLTTADLEAFHRGMANFSAFCRDTVSSYRADKWHVVFNLVGGFKTLVAYGALLGMAWADEQVYLFEAPGSPLLRIPRMPVSLTMDDALRAHMMPVRRLARGLSVTTAEVEALPEALVYRIGDALDLSTWALRNWEELRPNVYATELLPSPSPRVVFGERFAKSVAGQPSDRVRLVNERIDDLSCWAEAADKDKKKMNPKRLDVKEVKGASPTLECDAWADRDARRIYFTYEGGVATLDRLAAALH